eukprot:snap_masked-scaffold_14-processed-gene-2.31-mRNA-1 protein AED:1.00 eAED:1.00 QI:0/-1/0/0/-1/1/1/0/115
MSSSEEENVDENKLSAVALKKKPVNPKELHFAAKKENLQALIAEENPYLGKPVYNPKDLAGSLDRMFARYSSWSSSFQTKRKKTDLPEVLSEIQRIPKHIIYENMERLREEKIEA